MWDIHRTQSLFLFALKTDTLGINNRVNETLGITVKLKTTSEPTNSITQIILIFLSNGWKPLCEDCELNFFPHVADD
jgi:hypothetical protein